MKKKLLAMLLSVVMLVSLLVPVLAISAEGTPDAKIALGENIGTQVIKNVKYLTIPVVITENTAELVGLRYQVISAEGLTPYSFLIGDFVGEYEDDFGNPKSITFEATVNNKEYTDRLQILHAVSTNDYGITTNSGTLGTAYFVAPTEVGTYNFEIKVIDASLYTRDPSGTPSAGDAQFGYVTQKVTYTVECTNHVEGEPEETKPATCTEKGEAVIKCTACGKVLDTKEIPALDHDWDDGVTAENVPCGSTADKTYTCTREGCGETKKETGAKVEHNWVEDTAAYVAPKCGVAGKKVYKCENVNCPEKTKEEPVAALDHDWDNGTADSSKVCGETADVIYKCTREGCDETDVKSGDVIQHDWKLDADKCVDPKCGVAGKKVYVCQRANCPDNEKEEPVAALEHVMVEDTAAYVAPKCGVEGKKVFKCSREDCNHTEEKPVDALEHDMVEDVSAYVAPKCGVEGKKVFKCSREDCNYTEEKPVDALEHVFDGEKVVTKKPTADEKGAYTIACSNEDCTEVKEFEIAKLDKVVDSGDGLYFESDEANLPEDITLEATDGKIDENKGIFSVTFTFASQYAELKGDVVVTMDTAEFDGFKNFAIYTKDAEGTLVEVETELKDGKLTFNANLEGEYVLQGEMIKTSPETSDASNVVVFAVVALMALVALVVVAKKRFAL